MCPLLIFFLFLHLSLLSASFPCFRPRQPLKALNIDRYHRRNARERRSEIIRNFFFSSYNEKSDLRKLYEAVEDKTVNLLYNPIPQLPRVDFVFDQNRFYSYSPAEWAIVSQNQSALQYFISDVLLNTNSEYFIRYTVKILLITAIECGNLEAFKYLYDPLAYSLPKGEYISIAAKHHVDDEFLYFLLDDCNLNVQLNNAERLRSYTSPLEAAVRFNNPRAALIFISKGANLSTSLNFVFSLNRKRLLETLLIKRSDLCDLENESLLHYAARYATDPTIIDVILEFCPLIDVNVLDSNQLSPLEFCLSSGSPHKFLISKKLLENGADLMLKDSCALPLIISEKMVDVFNLALNIYLSDELFIEKCLELIYSYQSWACLDQLLLLRPEYIEFFGPKNIPVSLLIKEKAINTFSLLIHEGFLSVTQARQHALESRSKKFIEVLEAYY